MNFFLTDRELIDVERVVDLEHWSSYESTSKTKLGNEEDIELLIVKGSKGRYSYAQGSGDEESLKNFVDLQMSQPFKRMKGPLEEAFNFEVDL